MAGTYTRRDWAVALLAALGNNSPSEGTINFVINWTDAENNQTQAGFNLLNTTLPINGSKNVGVQGNIQSYRSFADGITGNADTIKNGLYPVLYASLLNNDVTTLDAGGSEIQKEMSTWGTHDVLGSGWKNFFSQTPPASQLAQQEPGQQTVLIQPGSPGDTIVTTIQNTAQLLANLASAWQVLSNPGTWIRVGLFVTALALLVIGVIIIDTAPKQGAS